jgi:hypothetical protein
MKRANRQKRGADQHSESPSGWEIPSLIPGDLGRLRPVGGSFAFSVGDLSASPTDASVLIQPAAPGRESAPLLGRLARLVFSRWRPSGWRL